MLLKFYQVNLQERRPGLRWEENVKMEKTCREDQESLQINKVVSLAKDTNHVYE